MYKLSNKQIKIRFSTPNLDILHSALLFVPKKYTDEQVFTSYPKSSYIRTTLIDAKLNHEFVDKNLFDMIDHI